LPSILYTPTMWRFSGKFIHIYTNINKLLFLMA
jgi:hypothetical protein